MPMIPFSHKLVQESMCQEPSTLIFSRLLSIKLELGLTDNFSIPNSSYLENRMQQIILQEDIILLANK